MTKNEIKPTWDETVIKTYNKKDMKAFGFIVNLGNDNVLIHIKGMELTCDVWKNLKIV
jgi:hypothetical protein